MNARTLAPLALLLAAGCGLDNFASVQFFEICYPPVPTNGVCVYPAACESTLLGRPLIDVGQTGPYNLELAVQINNQLKSNADPSTGRVNTNDAHITQYSTTYSNGAPGSVALANDTIPSEGNTVVLLEVLPALTVQLLGPVAPVWPGAPPATIVAEVVASGRYDSGDNFKTGPYKIALDICAGCLGIATSSLCLPSGTTPTVFNGGCPGSAVNSGGLVVSVPFNYECK